jgi:hypothetical protein
MYRTSPRTDYLTRLHKVCTSRLCIVTGTCFHIDLAVPVLRVIMRLQIMPEENYF